MTRLARIAKGLGALALLAALLGGIPFALGHFVGWPLPHRLPSWSGLGQDLDQHGIPDHTLIDALAIAVWITWAVLVASVVAELPAAVHGRSARRLPLAGAFQPLTGRLVAAVFVAALSFAPRPTHTSSASLTGIARAAGRQPVAAYVLTDATAPGVAAPVSTEPGSRAGVSTNGVQSSTVTSGRPPAAELTYTERTYVVRRGDTLWGVAERELGDPLRWDELYKLNVDHPQPDGATLTDPHWIDPGWTLVLPASPGVVPTAPDRTGAAPTPTTPVTTTPVHPSPVTTAPTPRTAAPAGPSSPHAPSAPRVPSTRPGNEPTGGAHGRPVGARGPTQAQTGNHADNHGAHSVPAIELSSGARVGGALVAGVLAALVALRLRRRQRYRPRAPRPGRRLDAPALTPTLCDLLAVWHAREEDGDTLTAHVGARLPLTQIPDDESFAAPDRIEVGTVQTGAGRERTVELALGEWPALVLCGPGAEATLRAWCAALVVRNGPYNVEIITPRILADRLLPGAELPSVHRTGDAAATCVMLEREFIGRTRTLDDADVLDAATYRSRYPADPFPFVVAVAAEVPDQLRGRWQVLTDAAGRLGAATIVLGESPARAVSNNAGSDRDARLVVEHDGTLLHASPNTLAAQLDGARLFQLGADEAADLLAPVAAVHNYAGPDDEVAPDDRPPEDATSNIVALDAEDAWPAPRPIDAESPPATIAFGMPRDDKSEMVPVGPARPVRVCVLGPAHVEAFGEVVTSGLRQSAYELLAWYLLRPEGATIEAAADALWPDATTKRGRERFWTALGNLRTRLGRPPGTDGEPLEILAKVGEHYVPDAAVLDVDLWRFEAALGDAARASDDALTIEALSRAVASYGGDLCPGTDYLWSEPVREDLHRRCLDAYLRLAELHEEEGRLEAAVAVLEEAIERDPICEEMHRRLVTLLGHLGYYDAALRVGTLLKGRLAEIDLDPEPATDAVIAELRRTQERVASGQQARDAFPDR